MNQVRKQQRRKQAKSELKFFFLRSSHSLRDISEKIKKNEIEVSIPKARAISILYSRSPKSGSSTYPCPSCSDAFAMFSSKLTDLLKNKTRNRIPIMNLLFQVHRDRLPRFHRSCVSEQFGISADYMNSLKIQFFLQNFSTCTVLYNKRGQRSIIDHSYQVLINRFLMQNSSPSNRSKPPLYYFDPQFKSVVSKSYPETSVLFALNKYLESNNLAALKTTTFSDYFKFYASTYSIRTNKSDYCNTCSELSNQISKTKRRLIESEKTNACNQGELKSELSEIEATIREHRHQAKSKLDSYRNDVKRSQRSLRHVRSLSHVMGNPQTYFDALNCGKFVFLMRKKRLYIFRSAQELFLAVSVLLSAARYQPLTLSLDFMSDTLYPSHSLSQKPSAEYYSKKHKMFTFGCVVENLQLKEKQSRLVKLIPHYVAGNKSSDTLISLLHCCLRKLFDEYPFRRLVIYMDNAAYNKNRYVLAYLHWLSVYFFDEIRLDFLVAGHAKMNADRMFGILKKRSSYSDFATESDYVANFKGICQVEGYFGRGDMREW